MPPEGLTRLFMATGAVDLLLARVAAGIEAAGPLPGGRAHRTFRTLGNRDGLDIPEIDAPKSPSVIVDRGGGSGWSCPY